MTPEGKLKAFVKDRLREIGAYFFMPVQTGYGTTTLDFLCCVDGTFVAIETKRKGKKPTRLQQLKIQEIEDAGGIAFFCDDAEGFIHVMHRQGFVTREMSVLWMSKYGDRHTQAR